MRPFFISLAASLLFFNLSVAQTSGGPDAYGYTWRSSNDSLGPTFDWLNIQDVGVLVTGLTDDNASSIIDIGTDFHYYWYDVNQVVIGSNGWVSFNPVSNIAHCFPTIPSAGGVADNYLAPFMTDLLMNASGTNAEIYYWHDTSNDRFVISYINVPWWQQAAPGYIGLNTFQVILSNADSSITFQYLDMDQASLANNGGCVSDLIIGMENVSGNIGLGLDQFTEVVPPDSFAVRFYPPDTALLNIADVTPIWNQNPENKGVFVPSSEDFDLSSTVKNLGNVDITSNTAVSTQLVDLNVTMAYNSNDLIPAIQAGQEIPVAFSDPANLPPGQYAFNVSVNNLDDINPGNNQRITEVNAVDVDGSDVLLTYATLGPPTGSVSWTGGGGMAVYIEPPIYTATLNEVDLYVQTGANGASEFSVQVLLPDGPDGVPGTVLESVVVDSGSYFANSWVNVPLPSPVDIDSGGVYLAFMHGTDGVALGTETAGPISRRSMEFVSQTWTTYRENSTTDLLIGGRFDFNPSTNGFQDQTHREITVYPNPSGGIFMFGGIGSSAHFSVVDLVGNTVPFNAQRRQNGWEINLFDVVPGIYLVRREDKFTNIVRKVVVN